jgi:DNA-binding NarL/FixJ family response regulator
VVLSLHKERDLVDAALKLGAKAYVLKDNALDEIAEAARAALDGRAWTSPRLDSHFDDDPLARLTPAELRVLRLLAENKTSPQIAAELHLSVRTVQNHRAHACEKLGFTGAHRLLQFALENRERVRAMTTDD